MKQEEIKARIAKLKKQVKRAEEKGNFDSAHHRVLSSYEKMLKPVAGVTQRNARKGVMEDKDGE